MITWLSFSMTPNGRPAFTKQRGKSHDAGACRSDGYCPAPKDIVRHVLGLTSGISRSRLMAHVTACALCRVEALTLMSALDASFVSEDGTEDLL